MQTARASKSKRSTAKTELTLTDMNTDDDTFQHQALEIRQPGEDFDPSVAPQSGEEFLMKMLYERKRCPAVVVKRPKNVQTIVDCSMRNNAESEFSDCSPSSLRPTPEWKAYQVADFLATRERVDIMRQELKSQNYNEELEPPLTNDFVEWQNFCREHQPLLSTILRINQRSLEELLEMICEWLREGVEPQEVTENQLETKIEDEPVASSSVAAAAALDDKPTPFDLSSSQQWLGSWLYAALTCLHLPLEPDVHSTLRDIARLCIRLRNRLLEQEIEKAVPYNLFIYIIAKVFDQLDFADYV